MNETKSGIRAKSGTTIGRSGLLCGAALAAMVAGRAEAQQAPIPAPAAQPADDDTGLKDIIVTAQKRSEASSKVGLSIVSVSGDALARQNITQAEDLVRVVPGFSYGYSGYNTPVYSIRGVGFNDSSLAGSPTVSVYVDQVSLPYAAMTQGAMLDVERLEVLKGPQGTLFGQNATGGAINIIANKPTDHLAAGGSISFSRFADAQAQGYVSGPLADGLRARLALSREIGGDWQVSATRGDTLGATNRGAGRFLLDWDASPNLKFAFNANGWFDKSDTQAAQLVAVDFGNANPATHVASVANAPIAPNDDRVADWNPAKKLQRNDRFYQLSLRADLTLGEAATLTSITAYNRYRTNSISDLDGIAAANTEIVLDGDARAFNQELRLAGDAGPLHWLVGGSYSKDKVRDDQPIQDYPTSSGSQSLVGVYTPRGAAIGTQNITSKAAFGNAEWKVIDSIKLVGGVRYTKEDRDFRGCAIGLDGDGTFGSTGASSAGGTAYAYGRLANALNGLALLPANPTYVNGQCITIGPAPSRNATAIVTSLNESNLSWNAGINFTPAEGSLLYARVSKGYKSGSFPTIAYVTYAQGSPVTQESVMAYEAGFKTILFNRHLRVEGALFYYDYTNKQVKSKRFFTEISSSLNALNNIPKSWVKGAELSFTAEPLRGLSFSGAVNYLDTRITEFTGFPAVGDPPALNLAGSQLNYSPHWQLQGGSQYEWAVSEKLRASLGIDASYHSLATAGIGVQLPTGGHDTRFDLPAYALVDLRVGIRDANDRWGLSIWGKNVTNSFYVTNAFRAVDTIVRFTGRPATYGATISVKY
jgi:iron complex outermembrane receptor protein